MLKYKSKYNNELIIKKPMEVYKNKNKLIGLVILKNFSALKQINNAKTNSSIWIGTATFLS